LDTVLSQFQGETQSTLSSLIAGLGSGGQNCRIAYGTYTGVPEQLAPTSDLGFYPICAFMSVIVGIPYYTQNPAFFVRGHNGPVSQLILSNVTVNVDWTDTCFSLSGDIRGSFRDKGEKFAYVVLGFSKPSEQGQ